LSGKGVPHESVRPGGEVVPQAAASRVSSDGRLEEGMMDESPVRGLHRHHAGFLLQWPTLLTVVMFPVLAWAYVRLARREEEEVRATFGEAYARYAAATPAFIPRVKGAAGRRTDARSSHP
jgi:hypothetical protein